MSIGLVNLDNLGNDVTSLPGSPIEIGGNSLVMPFRLKKEHLFWGGAAIIAAIIVWGAVK